MCGIFALLADADAGAGDATASTGSSSTTSTSTRTSAFSTSSSSSASASWPAELTRAGVTRSRAVALSRRQRHRGPDWSGVWTGRTTAPTGGAKGAATAAALLHERLAICGVESGAQPLLVPTAAAGSGEEAELVLCVNGEIYNDGELRAGLPAELRARLRTASDCEVIAMLYRHLGIEATLQRLRGMFAFVLVDVARGCWFAARDHVGMVPLYAATTSSSASPRPALTMFASELKVLVDAAGEGEGQLVAFPPGHYVASYDVSSSSSPAVATPLPFKRWYAPAWLTGPAPTLALPKPSLEEEARVMAELRERLTAAVRTHLMGDVPWGLLLSGGLDSSLVAALAAKQAHTRVDADVRFEGDDARSDDTRPHWPRVHTFSVGLAGAGASPDLVAARGVAEHIGSVHHEVVFTVEEAADALPEVIRHIESYDVTTVRSSIPMFLLSQHVRACGIKMVLSGEGADELLAGYLYFRRAPDAKALHEETVRKVTELHGYDCLRANKAMMAHGVEARTPFLDRGVADYAMDHVHPHLKLSGTAAQALHDHPDPRRSVEKWILRKAFDDSARAAGEGEQEQQQQPLLPDDVLWRQKEQFSDGVGYAHIDALVRMAEETVSDADMARAAELYPVHTPATKEAFMYRKIFDDAFPGARAEDAVRTVPHQESVACSTAAAIAWDAAFKARADPSGRSVADHVSTVVVDQQ